MYPIGSSNRPRILLAEDHTLVAEACRKLLEPEYEVVGIVADGLSMVRASMELHPDVIIADIGMQQLNGLDAAAEVMERDPTVRVIFLTMNDKQELAVEAFRRGAAGYLLKTSAASELMLAVRSVLQGTRYLSPILSKTDVRRFVERHRSGEEGEVQLSLRQREVLQLLAEGKCMKEVGSALNLATRTVAFHKYRIMAALGIKTNAELVHYAIRKSIISAAQVPLHAPNFR